MAIKIVCSQRRFEEMKEMVVNENADIMSAVKKNGICGIDICPSPFFPDNKWLLQNGKEVLVFSFAET